MHGGVPSLPAWIANQSHAATATTDPLLAARAAAETHRLAEITAHHASRLALVPMLAETRTGPDGLAHLLATAIATPT